MAYVECYCNTRCKQPFMVNESLVKLNKVRCPYCGSRRFNQTSKIGFAVSQNEVKAAVDRYIDARRVIAHAVAAEASRNIET